MSVVVDCLLPRWPLSFFHPPPRLRPFPLFTQRIGRIEWKREKKLEEQGMAKVMETETGRRAREEVRACVAKYGPRSSLSVDA